MQGSPTCGPLSSPISTPVTTLRELGLALLNTLAQAGPHNRFHFLIQSPLLLSAWLAKLALSPYRLSDLPGPNLALNPGPIMDQGRCLTGRAVLGDEVLSALQKTRSGQFGGTSRGQVHFCSVF